MAVPAAKTATSTAPGDQDRHLNVLGWRGGREGRRYAVRPVANDPATLVLPRAALADEIAEAARSRASAGGFPAGRIDRIRAAAGRLAASEFRPDDLRHGALLLERQATVDLEVPTASRVPGVSIVKRVIKKVMIWYLRFLGHQISAFGQATARFGVTVANRVDALDAEVADLKARVEALEARRPGAGG